MPKPATPNVTVVGSLNLDLVVRSPPRATGWTCR
jgi:hypothetical protein